MDNTQHIDKPDENEWLKVQIMVPPSLWPLVRVAAAKRGMEIRELVSELLTAGLQGQS